MALLHQSFHDPFTLGRCGTIPASLITLLKETFGLDTSRADEYAKMPCSAMGGQDVHPPTVSTRTSGRLILRMKLHGNRSVLRPNEQFP